MGLSWVILCLLITFLSLGCENSFDQIQTAETFSVGEKESNTQEERSSLSDEDEVTQEQTRESTKEEDNQVKWTLAGSKVIPEDPDKRTLNIHLSDDQSTPIRLQIDSSPETELMDKRLLEYVKNFSGAQVHRNSINESLYDIFLLSDDMKQVVQIQLLEDSIKLSWEIKLMESIVDSDFEMSEYIQSMNLLFIGNNQVSETNTLTPLVGIKPLVCPKGTHNENEKCVANIRSCSISNGTGVEEWMSDMWGSCQVLTCNMGFEEDKNECKKSFPKTISGIFITECQANASARTYFYAINHYKMDGTHELRSYIYLDRACTQLASIISRDSEYTLVGYSPTEPGAFDVDFSLKKISFTPGNASVASSWNSSKVCDQGSGWTANRTRSFTRGNSCFKDTLVKTVNLISDNTLYVGRYPDTNINLLRRPTKVDKRVGKHHQRVKESCQGNNPHSFLVIESNKCVVAK